MRKLLWASLLGIALAAPAFAGPAAKLVTAEGQVKINGKPADAGAILNERDRLKVGAKSRAVVVLASGSAFRLGPESDLDLQTLGKRTRLNLRRGDILSVVKSGSDYRVKAPKVVAAVRGTIFYLQATPIHPSLVCICNGSLDAAYPGKQGRTISADHHAAYAVKPRSRWVPLGMSGHTDDEAADLEQLAKTAWE